jgi:hypothetical protein
VFGITVMGLATIPVFVINMKKDSGRRAAMERQLAVAGLNHEFVEGFAGADQRVRNSYDVHLSLKEWGVPLNTGERGCAFSHRRIYERMLAEEIRCALILEDDAQLAAGFGEIVQRELERAEIDWDWLQLGYPAPGLAFVRSRIGDFVRMPRRSLSAFLALSRFLGAIVIEYARSFLAGVSPARRGAKVLSCDMPHSSAYLITLEGVTKVLPFVRPIRFPADVVPHRARAAGLRYMCYVPTLVTQDPRFATNTSE